MTTETKIFDTMDEGGETDDYTPLWLEIPFSEDEAETLLEKEME